MTFTDQARDRRQPDGHCDHRQCQQRHRRASGNRDPSRDRQFRRRLGANPFQMTIHGFGFDPTAADNTVTFNRSTRAHCHVTALTVNFTGRPTTVGTLTAIVTTDTISSGTAVQVGTVIPFVFASTANLAAKQQPDHDQRLRAPIRPPPIRRWCCSTTAAFSTIAAATATSLTVTFSTRPTNAGSLTVVVSTNDESSGNPVQVATVTYVRQERQHERLAHQRGQLCSDIKTLAFSS